MWMNNTSIALSMLYIDIQYPVIKIIQSFSMNMHY